MSGTAKRADRAGRAGPSARALVGSTSVVAVAALLAFAACGAASTPASSARDAIVRITSNVAEASLFVDGRFLAPVGLITGGVALSPGRHRLELRHEGYLARFIELELAPAERKQVDARLFPVLP